MAKRPESLIQIVRRAWADPETREAAEQAYELFKSYCDGPMPRVPGMDTVLRITVRIDCGHSVEVAAAREYMYRWSLAMKSRTFGVPHLLGE